MISSETVVLFVAIGILLAVALTLIGIALIQAWMRQQAKKQDKDHALLGAIQSVHAAMQAVAERMNDKANMLKENHAAVMCEVHELGTLVLDVERRLRDEIVENRNVIREGRSGGHHGTRIDITGGRVNQVGGKIENE